MAKLLGHTRYSLFQPNSISWRATGGSRFASPEEYKAYLHSEERMAVREAIFIGQSLPQLAAAAEGHELVHVVSFSDVMPEKHKEKLREAAERYPFLYLDEQGEKEGKDLEELAIEEFWSEDAESVVFGQFRLDDDDLISAGFFNQMNRYIDEPFVGMQVSFSRGIEAIWDKGHTVSFLRDAYFPFIAIGLMSVRRITNGAVEPFKMVNHTMSDRNNPVIMDSTQISYMRYNHTGQDTAIKADGTMAVHDIANFLLRFPELPYDVDVKELFPALAGELTQFPEYQVEVSSTPGDPAHVVEIAEPMNAFRMSIGATFGEGVAPHQYLLRLHLQDEGGQPLTGGQQISGIGLSPNPMIGYFRYLKSAPGHQNLKEEIILPEGVECAGIDIYAWRDLANSIEIDEVKVRRLL